MMFGPSKTSRTENATHSPTARALVPHSRYQNPPQPSSSFSSSSCGLFHCSACPSSASSLPILCFSSALPVLCLSSAVSLHSPSPKKKTSSTQTQYHHTARTLEALNSNKNRQYHLHPHLAFSFRVLWRRGHPNEPIHSGDIVGFVFFWLCLATLSGLPRLLVSCFA